MTVLFTVGNQRADTDNRVIDVLGKLVAQFGANFFIALADTAVRGGEAFSDQGRFRYPKRSRWSCAIFNTLRIPKSNRSIPPCDPTMGAKRGAANSASGSLQRHRGRL
jgi:hypothetical protein